MFNGETEGAATADESQLLNEQVPEEVQGQGLKSQVGDQAIINDAATDVKHENEKIEAVHEPEQPVETVEQSQDVIPEEQAAREDQKENIHDDGGFIAEVPEGIQIDMQDGIAKTEEKEEEID